MPAMITSEHLPLSITGPTNSRANAAAMEKTRQVRRQGSHRTLACQEDAGSTVESLAHDEATEGQRDDKHENKRPRLRMVVLTDIWHENPPMIPIPVFYVCKK